MKQYQFKALQKRDEEMERAKAEAKKRKAQKRPRDEPHAPQTAQVTGIYATLPQELNQMQHKATPLDTYARKLLDGKPSIENILNEKVRHKALSFDPIKDDQTERPRKRQRRLLSAKERKSLKVFDLTPEECKYDAFMPLHELWKQYLTDLTIQSNGSDFNGKLLKADLHGAIVKVTRSRTPQFVGLEGIIVQETYDTFRLITSKNEQRVIPKKDTVFTFVFDGHLITVFGDNIEMRTAERSVRKFKNKTSIDF